MCASSETQKAAFKKGEILLNSWELLCFILCAHIESLPSYAEFYKVPQNRKQFSDSPDDDIGRLDDGRLALVVLTKLMDFT